MQADEYGKMASVENRHWWYRALRRRLIDEVDPSRFRKAAPRWLDAGAGTGGLLQFLDSEMNWKGVGFDIAPPAVEQCRRKSLNVSHGNLSDPATWPTGVWDVITSNDSFYFVRETHDRIRVLEAMWDRLAPGGRVILHLPALKAFSGSHDLPVGITERLNRAEALSWTRTRPWKVRRASYRLFFLSPLIFASRALSRWKLKRSGNAAADAKSDVEGVNPVLNVLFYFLTRTEDQLRMSWPWGSSLLVVLEKPET
jgi:SAM-dependent methyltransferase